jgi:hypothetical protein
VCSQSSHRCGLLCRLEASHKLWCRFGAARCQDSQFKEFISERDSLRTPTPTGQPISDLVQPARSSVLVEH